MGSKTALIPRERIAQAILLIRGRRIVLDEDLAVLYGVTTSRLNEQVKRNLDRFPLDFSFLLTPDEYNSLRSQFAILKTSRGKHRKYLPRVFTEHGALMAASVLNSSKAVEMSIYVVRAFVRLRNLLTTHRQLAIKLEKLEQKYTQHDKQIVVLFDAIRELMEPPAHPKRKIGFGERGYREGRPS